MHQTPENTESLPLSVFPMGGTECVLLHKDGRVRLVLNSEELGLDRAGRLTAALQAALEEHHRVTETRITGQKDPF